MGDEVELPNRVDAEEGTAIDGPCFDLKSIGASRPAGEWISVRDALPLQRLALTSRDATGDWSDAKRDGPASERPHRIRGLALYQHSPVAASGVRATGEG
jgi:hypothetical protein